ncbi:aminoglycoside phosphotransferase family protein [Moraxella sp. VT-16-12]|uniref:aminoglycoside phosphotransferase family protein n=1 Tax=Moraxella sp. VT-16-12 TaxID=2014877 RepID=UPI000B7F6097|nr:phosphotransferase [Moraxella sp. VT-16-12]TWV82033.1 phosphotransferase [Moraxella sp. VT-16-12]
MTRHDRMMAFLHDHLTQDFHVETLAGDASFRRYHRIHFDLKSEQNHTHMTYLLMDAPPEKESVVEFVKVADILSERVNAPDIIARDMEQGFLLLQDYGTTEFAHVITNKDQKDAYYQQALDTLVQLQKIQIDVDLPLYDNDVLIREMNLFTQWFLPYVGVNGDFADGHVWQQLHQVLTQSIQSQPKVIVHRDYHSRNLMIDKSSGSLGVIDFQDALIGADTYDLVSLVRDAYIDDDEDWVMTQITKFHSLSLRTDSLFEFVRDVNVMGVQRHLKVLGIFVRLSQRDGKERYLANIPKVMKDLIHELTWLTQKDIHPIYGEFLGWLNTEVLPKYHHKFNVA